MNQNPRFQQYVSKLRCRQKQEAREQEPEFVYGQFH